MQTLFNVVVQFVSAQAITAEEPFQPGRWRQIGWKVEFCSRCFLHRGQHRFKLPYMRGKARDFTERVVKFIEEPFSVPLLNNAGVFFLLSRDGFTPETPRMPGQDLFERLDLIFG